MSNLNPPRSIEKTLELLEARFTAPVVVVNQSSNNNPSSPDTMTIGPSQLSNASGFSQHSHSASHSFAFDMPTLSVPAPNHHSVNSSPHNQREQPNHHNRYTSPQQQQQQQPQLSVDQVSQAAALHIAKIMSSEFSQQSTRQGGNLSSSSMLTVHETPPPPTSTTTATRDSTPTTWSPPKRSPLLLGSSTNTTTTAAPSRRGKRKSTPVKKQLGEPIVPEQRQRSSKRRGLSVSETQRDGDPRSTSGGIGVTAAPTVDKSTTTPPPPMVVATSTKSSRVSTNTRSSKSKIDDFFGPKNSQNNSSGAATTTAASISTTIGDATTSAETIPNASSLCVDVVRTNVRKTIIGTVTTTSSSSSKGILLPKSTEDLEYRIEQLQRDLLDKDEQLKAVSNNRSILHGALQAALSDREEELYQLKQNVETQQKRYHDSLEKLIREQAERQAKHVRETLALNAARLGRVVHSRAGLRHVESWEDGSASKQLRVARQALQHKKQTLEKRRIAQTLMKQQSLLSPSTSSDNVWTLESAAELASIEYHQRTLARTEARLEQEEKALQMEKTAHVRALKRVACEDASRFRNRPKLHDRYVLLSLLGKGGFSEVWEAYDLFELRTVAVKIHQLDPRWSDSKKESFTKHVSREYEIHRNVRHPRIVSLYDVFEIDMNSFATVLECCSGSDLDTLLKERRQLPESDARAILLQILVGMRYLSQPSEDGKRQGIIHYDLKPGNILFDEFGDAKITDFGLSKIVEGGDPAESMELTSQGAGTYWYLPPECFVLDEQIRISNKVDVWAIGVIFYQMLYGKRPFGDGFTQDKLLTERTMLNARNVRFPNEPLVSAQGREFLQSCLKYDQEERPTIAQLCENPYVTSVGIML